MSKRKKKKKAAIRKRKSTLRSWHYAIAVALFSMLLYLNTLNHGFVLDDDLVCVKNEFVQKGFSGLGDIFTSSWYEGFNGEKDNYYRPMMLAGFAIEKGMFGHGAKIYHAMNILWYGVAIGLLFLLLQELFPSKEPWFTLAIVTLFAAHPIHTEVVANIKSRDEIFALLGLIGMLYGMMRYEQTQLNKWLGLSVVAYFFALLSKESSLAFIALVPLTLYYFTENDWKSIANKSLPYWIIAGFYSLIRSKIVSSDKADFNLIDNSLFAAEGLAEQTATAVAMMGKYLSLLIFPHPLIYDYSYAQIPLVGWGSWQALLSLVLIVGLLGYAIYSWKNKDKVGYAILFFAITSVITSNFFFLIGATFAERFMFVPSLAFCMLVVILLQRFLDKPGQHKIIWGVVGFLGLVYAGKTINQNPVWENNTTLFSYGIQVAPSSARVNSYYGKALYDRALANEDVATKTSLLKESETYFKRAIEILPSYTQAYQNMGLVLEEQGSYEQALTAYQKGISTESDYYPLHTNAGILLYNRKRYNEALSYLQNAVEFGPNDPRNYNALGLTQHKLQNYDAAIAAYKKAHELQPKHVPYLGNLVTIYRELNQVENAIFYDKQIKALQGK